MLVSQQHLVQVGVNADRVLGEVFQPATSVVHRISQQRCDLGQSYVDALGRPNSLGRCGLLNPPLGTRIGLFGLLGLRKEAEERSGAVLGVHSGNLTIRRGGITVVDFSFRVIGSRWWQAEAIMAILRVIFWDLPGDR